MPRLDGIVNRVMALNGEGMKEGRRRKPNKAESNYWKEASVIWGRAQYTCKGYCDIGVMEYLSWKGHS